MDPVNSIPQNMQQENPELNQKFNDLVMTYREIANLTQACRTKQSQNALDTQYGQMESFSDKHPRYKDSLPRRVVYKIEETEPEAAKIQQVQTSSIQKKSSKQGCCIVM